MTLRPIGRPACRAAGAALSLLLWAGCTMSVPLGGLAPNRGRPLPARSFQLSLAPGAFPNLAGAVPEVVNEEVVINPVPGVESLRTGAGWGGLFGLGVGLGVTDRVDVSLSFPRGLDAMIRVADLGPFSLSLSPAYYRHTQTPGDGDALFWDTAVWSRVSNRNLTALVDFRPETREGVDIDAYLGAGVNRYVVEIRDQWRRHPGTAPTALGGVTLDISYRHGFRTVLTSRLSVEGTGTWITQRNGRRDFVVSERIQLGFRSWPAW